MTEENKQLASIIDHTYLKPDCTYAHIDQVIREANEYGFAAICIPPMFVQYAAEKSASRNFKLCTVMGFPIAYDHEASKVMSFYQSIENGAQEIDIVNCLSHVKSELWRKIEDDLVAFKTLSLQNGITLKWIIETSLLTLDEMKRMCDICNEVEPDFVKTSTGFFGAPVTPEVVVFLRKHLRSSIQIKASGGIQTYTQAMSMVDAGADRLGCSQSVQIVTTP